jgi:hypothetical protein
MNYFSFSGSTSTIINTFITPFKNSPAQLYFNNALFLSTFAGDNQGTWLENNSDINGAWQNLKNQAGVAVSYNF